MAIKRDDNVIVIAGKEKGNKGKVVKSFPKDGLILVSGINKRKRHIRARGAGKKGEVIEKEFPIHVSNVKLDK